AGAAERRGEEVMLLSHRLADAVRQEPRRFHAALEHPLHLTRADALLGGAHEVDDLKPEMQRQVRAFEDRALAHRELTLAAPALVQPKAGRLAGQPIDLLARRLAVRAHRAVRPQQRLDVREGGGFVAEVGLIEDRAGHRISPWAHTSASG